MPKERVILGIVDLGKISHEGRFFARRLDREHADGGLDIAFAGEEYAARLQHRHHRAGRDAVVFGEFRPASDGHHIERLLFHEGFGVHDEFCYLLDLEIIELMAVKDGKKVLSFLFDIFF